MAGAAALGVKACNGWHFWQTDTPRWLVRLSRVRDDHLERQTAPVSTVPSNKPVVRPRALGDAEGAGERSRSRCRMIGPRGWDDHRPLHHR